MISNILSKSFCLSMSYEYIDSGNFLRLEKFGNYIVKRSCPSATWDYNKDITEWNKPDLTYIGSSGKPGTWQGINPNQWQISIENMKFNLNISTFGQIGIFPEQIQNWKFIQNIVKDVKKPMKVLNLFAYTGGSSIASTFCSMKYDNIDNKTPLIEVTHLDSAKSFIAWAKDNAMINNCDNNIRFINDDCMTFIDREIRRGNKYDAIILDPPSFGRASGGKTWQFSTDFIPLINKLQQIISNDPVFFLVSCHDESMNSQQLFNTIKNSDLKLKNGKFSHGKLELKPIFSNGGNILPLGIYCRWAK